MRLTLFATATLCMSCFAAHADTFQSFNLNAILTHGVATGTVTFNESAGVFTGGDITATYGSNTFNFNVFDGSSSYDTVTFSQEETANGNQNFQLAIPGASDQNYGGGDVCSTTSFTGCQVTGGPAGDFYYTGFVYNGNSDDALSGTLTPASVTPEPSSFALLGTGLLGIAGVLRRRLA